MNFEITQCTVNAAYQFVIQSVFIFSIVSWFVHLIVKSDTKLSKVVKLRGAITGRKQPQPSYRHDEAVRLSI